MKKNIQKKKIQVYRLSNFLFSCYSTSTKFVFTITKYETKGEKKISYH